MGLAEALAVIEAAATASVAATQAVNDLIAAFKASGQVTDGDLASARAAAQASISDLETQVNEDLKA